MNNLSFHTFDVGLYNCFQSQSLILYHMIEDDMLKLIVTGRLTYDNLSLFRRYTTYLLDNEMPQHHTLLIDCNLTDHIDSTGFGMVIHLYRTLEKAGKKLKILNPPENTRELLLNSPFNACVVLDDSLPITENKQNTRLPR